MCSVPITLSPPNLNPRIPSSVLHHLRILMGHLHNAGEEVLEEVEEADIRAEGSCSGSLLHIPLILAEASEKCPLCRLLTKSISRLQC